MNKQEQKKVIEAILFLSEEQVGVSKIAGVLSISDDEVETLVRELKDDLAKSDRGLQVFEAAGGYQMGTIPELAPLLERAFSEDVSSNLSGAALEALAIIAYKQPVTRIEIESIRGVRCEYILENLLKRKLIKISGRREGPGRPLLYCTTPDFLKYFGLMDLGDLPPLEFEQNEDKPEEEDIEVESLEVENTGEENTEAGD